MPNLDSTCTTHRLACPCRERRFKAIEDWLRAFVEAEGFISAEMRDQARALLKAERAIA